MINSLTSFRFFAAFLVFLFHASIWKGYQLGYVGVSFFFILSGFILTINYKEKFARSYDRISVMKFYASRLAKIYPVHVLTFLVAIPYYFFIPLKHEPILYVFQAATNLLLFHSFIPFGNVSFNGVSWSLSNELFFYFMFPFILYFLMRSKLSTNYKFIAFGILWGLLLFGFAVLPNENDLIMWLAYFSPWIRIFEFIIGVVLALMFLDTQKRYAARISVPIFTILELFSVVLLLIFIFYSQSLPQYIRYGLVYTPFWCMIIYIFSFQKGALSSAVSNKLLVYLGKISFSFYMIHNLVLSYIFFLWKPPIHPAVIIAACFVISMLLSMTMYHYYEEPMRLKVKAYLDKLVLKNQKASVNPNIVKEVYR